MQRQPFGMLLRLSFLGLLIAFIYGMRVFMSTLPLLSSSSQKAMVISIAIVSILFVIACVVLMFLFLRRNHRFPKLIVSFCAFNALIILVMLPFTDGVFDSVIAIVSAIFWILYYTNAPRVQEIFIEKLGEKTYYTSTSVQPPKKISNDSALQKLWKH
ncbi:hypothetical protein [Candidatus Uabimicrobium amorphum]|uniref:Uncharacterized protein n=1 Tax=Uabimicrobium amorphum TaxID=2596890 RepID=A0A5S9ISY4_UABAM|nr:hypothetical protein [Candidatus Uabimicrobium amorphum]BBM87167.1 hypothetical protein UABAM_05570 [Candidatus Uabimicrobium amorphum]